MPHAMDQEYHKVRQWKSDPYGASSFFPLSSFCQSKEDILSAMHVTMTNQFNQKQSCPMPCNFLLIDVADRHVEKIKSADTAFLMLYFLPR